ncbi:hypothetical protein ACVB8X_15730 [Streptomyces sp. NRAIS4]
MIRLSKFQRLALLAASTTVITGGVLSHGAAFAATAAPHSAAASVAAPGHLEAAAQWKKITDTPSGITVQLPGVPKVQKDSDSGLNSRNYDVTTGYGVMGFSVLDGPAVDPSKPWDLNEGLKSVVDGFNSGDPSAKLKSTDAHEGTTKDGHHYLEAKLVGADGTVGHVRLVDAGAQAMVILNVGTDDHQKAVDQDYQQVLDSIHVPDHGTSQTEGSAAST